VTGWVEYEAIHGRNHTVTGRVVVWPKLASPQLGGVRDILVYLPPSLARSWRDGESAPGAAPAPGAVSATVPAAVSARRYPTLYFNDGENVFDELTAYVKEEWKADETLEDLAKDGIEAIAVAIPNGREARLDEYNPWRGTLPWKNLPKWATRREMGGKGDAYLSFVVDTVKPLIDGAFPTIADRSATGMIGSSMGGLISIYALAAQPAVFALAGVVSPSLRWSNFRILDVLREKPLRDVRIHLDIGGRESRGMTNDTRRLRDFLLDQGFAEGRDLHYVEERYGIHRESAWARRLPDALRFLLAETKLPNERAATAAGE
jgi:predicted alpha/beta superfamily hydrolase